MHLHFFEKQTHLEWIFFVVFESAQQLQVLGGVFDAELVVALFIERDKLYFAELVHLFFAVLGLSGELLLLLLPIFVFLLFFLDFSVLLFFILYFVVSLHLALYGIVLLRGDFIQLTKFVEVLYNGRHLIVLEAVKCAVKGVAGLHGLEQLVQKLLRQKLAGRSHRLQKALPFLNFNFLHWFFGSRLLVV